MVAEMFDTMGAMSKGFTLITGASAGIGKACAERFAMEGRHLILVARRADRLEALQKSLSGHGVEIRVRALDVADRPALDTFVDSLEGLTLDAVINNAGLALGTESFDAYDFADIDTMIDVNVKAMMRVAYRTLPFLKRSKGHLVNLGSIAGLETYAGGTVYCSTKHFVHAFTEGLRKDLLGSGVRVTTVAPGRVQTEFSDVRLKGDTAKAKQVYQGYVPLQAEDIADAIWYAVSRPAHVNVELMLVMPTAQAGLSVK